jgi:hypothetical protein
VHVSVLRVIRIPAGGAQHLGELRRELAHLHGKLAPLLAMIIVEGRADRHPSHEGAA